jgi:hypothetical protein
MFQKGIYKVNLEVEPHFPVEKVAKSRGWFPRREQKLTLSVVQEDMLSSSPILYSWGSQCSSHMRLVSLSLEGNNTYFEGRGKG